MAQQFVDKGYKVISDGTDNHSMLIDLRSKFPDMTGKVAENSLVNIYNLLGQKLLTTKLYNNEIINISKLSPGNYIIEFTKGNFTEVKKLNIIR